ncbi:conserved exported hypothetical protein [Verrucomicrobia bacterium]|nr:conserved exported hypothetical protein [Verrucomicrobiota bacterium]
MRTRTVLYLAALLAAAAPTLHAQTYSIDWYKIAGGGGTSTSATYQVSGTIGQQDAGGPMFGGNYQLTGGFWSLIAVVQTPGAPLLTIQGINPTTVLVSWPAPSTGFVLQQNNNLTTTNWIPVTNAVTVNAGTNEVFVSPPKGNDFYRLINP